MPYLKNKIRLLPSPYDDYDDQSDLEVDSEPKPTALPSPSVDSTSTVSSQIQEYPIATRKRRQKPTNPDGHSKNIVKNYGKALCSFASSAIALPYLELIIKREAYDFVIITSFMDYIKERRSGIHSIESLRKLLVPSESDDKVMRAYKKIFQEVSIIFLKYFCVNWIFGGRLLQKNAHLKFRFKMLRRIQNPEHFTYLQTIIK